MRKLTFALLCLTTTLTVPLALPSAWAAPDPAPVAAPAKKLPFEDEIIAFENADKISPPPLGTVLFTGSSSIRIWSTLAQDFPEITVLNRGFGGSLMENSVQYVDRITISYKPKMIVISAGTNDLANHHSPASILSDFQKYVEKVHAALPQTRIVYISINPSIARNERSAEEKAGAIETNNLIAQWIRENNGKVAPLTFIDTYSYLLTPAGDPRPDIFIADKHHLNAEGYASWAALLRPQILALLGVKAGTKPAPTIAP